MIYVLAGDYRQFQSFLYEFRLREHFSGTCRPSTDTTLGHGCANGQVRYLSDVDHCLRGTDHHNMVLVWGTGDRRRDYSEIAAYCHHRDIPLMHVPDLKRQRYARDREAQMLAKDRAERFSW